MKSDTLTWLDDPAVFSRLTTDDTLMKRLAHELDSEPRTARVEKAFLTIAKNKNACKIIRALVRALPDKAPVIFSNASAVFAKHSLPKAGSYIYPIVLEYQRKILNKSKAKKGKEAE